MIDERRKWRPAASITDLHSRSVQADEYPLTTL
jgi:hypothetical protein